MKKTHGPILAALAAGALALTGCSTIPLAGTSTPETEPAAAPATSAPAQTATIPATAPAPAVTATSPAAAVPSGQPPKNGAQAAYASAIAATTVPGLVAAIGRADHPGLQICGTDLVSQVFAKGDLRGNGGTQYLVDTTCNRATASSPDEVSLYDAEGSTIARSAVIYEFTANRPRTTNYPYLWQGHTVVLTYDGGAAYRLVQLTPNSVVPGLVQKFD